MPSCATTDLAVDDPDTGLADTNTQTRRKLGIPSGAA